MFFVYILYSPKYDKYYIGQTNNIDFRLHVHNKGLNPSTKPYMPWILKLAVPKNSRSEAMELERKLKNLSKKRLQSFIKKHGGPGS